MPVGALKGTQAGNPSVAAGAEAADQAVQGGCSHRAAPQSLLPLDLHLQMEPPAAGPQSLALLCCGQARLQAHAAPLILWG